MAQIPMSSNTLDSYQQHDSDLAPEHATSAMTAMHNSLFDGEVLDGVYRGSAPGIQMLGITTRRLIMLENVSRDGHLCLTSTPLSRLTSVGFLLHGDHTLDTATTILIRVTTSFFELRCRDRQDAREAHDLLVWQLIM